MGGLTKGLKQIAADLIQLLGKDKVHRGSKLEGRPASELQTWRSRSNRHGTAFSTSHPHASLPHTPTPRRGVTLFRDALSDDGAQATTSQSTKTIAPTALQQHNKERPATNATLPPVQTCATDSTANVEGGAGDCGQPSPQHRLNHPVSAPAALSPSAPCSSLCCLVPLQPNSTLLSQDAPVSAATDGSVVSESWWAANCASAVPAAAARAANRTPGSINPCASTSRPDPAVALEPCKSDFNAAPGAANGWIPACSTQAQQAVPEAASEPSAAAVHDCKGGCRPMPKIVQVYTSANLPAGMQRNVQSWSANDFDVIRKIHKGYSSSVYMASCLYSGTDVVLKTYNLAGLSTFLRNQVLRELDIHSRLRHPGVVHLLAAFREGDNLIMVQDFVRGGSLDRVRRKLGGRMTEFQVMHLVLLPLLGVLTYLHERGIVHRDIKPDNLLFTDNWKLKVCDFGVSICLREERAVTRTGTREYLAPEVECCPQKRLPEDNKDNLELAYSAAVDVWSLGALMYELLVGFTPFPGGPPARKEVARGSAGAALGFPSGISPSARVFVRDCLELDPADRPTVHQLMEHAWVREALIAAEALIAPK